MIVIEPISASVTLNSKVTFTGVGGALVMFTGPRIVVLLIGPRIVVLLIGPRIVELFIWPGVVVDWPTPS